MHFSIKKLSFIRVSIGPNYFSFSTTLTSMKVSFINQFIRNYLNSISFRLIIFPLTFIFGIILTFIYSSTFHFSSIKITSIIRSIIPYFYSIFAVKQSIYKISFRISFRSIKFTFTKEFTISPLSIIVTFWGC